MPYGVLGNVYPVCRPPHMCTPSPKLPSLLRDTRVDGTGERGAGTHATLRQLEESVMNAELRVERRGVQVGATRHGQTSAKDSQEWHDAHSGVQAQCVWSARTRGGHTKT